MISLSTTRNQLSDIFDNESLVILEPDQDWRVKIEEYNDIANVASDLQRRRIIYAMRQEQAKAIGFLKFATLESILETVTGEPHTETIEGERHTCLHFYDHLTDELKKDWGRKYTDYIRMEKLTAWFLPPFCKQAVWKFRHSYVNMFQKEMPIELVMRLKRLQSIKLFNYFSILAPVEAWESSKSDVPIILIGNISVMEDKASGDTSSYILYC